MNILEHIIGFLAPHACVSCGQEGALLCNECTLRLPQVGSRCFRCATPTESFRSCAACTAPGTPVQVWAATSYTGAAKALVHSLKFERAGAVARDTARAITATVPFDDTWTVTYIPTAHARARQRGYDQAHLIARQVARQAGCSHASLLIRQGGQRQVGQNRAVRQQQMQSAFRVSAAPQVAGKDILIVDDVLTTGATIDAAARVLYAAGARTVRAAVFAAA